MGYELLAHRRTLCHRIWAVTYSRSAHHFAQLQMPTRNILCHFVRGHFVDIRLTVASPRFLGEAGRVDVKTDISVRLFVVRLILADTIGRSRQASHQVR